MPIALLSVRLVLAAVFAVAALGKLGDRQGSEHAIVDFGFPPAIATAVARLLPVVELAVASALLAARTAWWGAAGALLLLVAFSLVIGRSLRRGRAPACHCFGRLDTAPAGWSTVARNAVLATGATLVVWHGPQGAGPSAVTWIAHLSASGWLAVAGGLITLAGLAVLAWFLGQLFAQHGRLLQRVEALEARTAAAEAGGRGADGQATAGGAAAARHGLPVGTPAPAFSLTALSGEATSLEGLLTPNRPLLLVFADPSCALCLTVLPDLAAWHREHVADLTFAIVSGGALAATRAKFGRNDLPVVLRQEQARVSERYLVFETPSAVLVRPDGRVGSAVAFGVDAIVALVADAAAGTSNGAPASHRHATRVSHVGAPAPALRLPDLTGHVVDLRSFRGQDTLVLFWNPDCTFCRRMAPELRAWEAAAAEGSPQLLVVSTGSVEANRALEFRSPLVLDASLAVGPAFGAGGTPCAVLVDVAGRIASDVAVGAEAILALAAPLEVRRRRGEFMLGPAVATVT